MTINLETAKSGPTAGNGSTTVFAYAFKVLDQAHLVVTQTVTATGAETIQTLTTHYTVSGVGSDGGGNVTMGVAPPSTTTLTITRAVPQTQTTDLVNRAAVVPATVETAIDRGVQMVQDFDEEITRAIKLPVSTNMASVSALLPAPVANAYIVWNGAGTALTTTTTATGQYLGGDGSVSAPFYSWAGDVNSGLFRIGSDNIGLSLNGTKHVDFSTSSTIFTGTVEAGGDTSAGDNAAMGYTAAEGLILTGQGGTNDVTIKNDADAIALEVPTGTQNVNLLGNLVLTGNLTVNGTTYTNDATNTLIKDPLIELNSGATSNANDLGWIAERGSTGPNIWVGWDESADEFVATTTSAVGSSTGNITIAGYANAHFANVSMAQLTCTSGTLAGITSLALNAGATITAGILDEDDMSSNSAVALTTQQAAKAYVDSSSKAAGIQMTWETATTDTDQGAGKVWANNGTLSSATILYFDDVENNSVSINAFIDTLDDPTATNSATIYIQEAGTATAGVVFAVSGGVVSASTYSKVSVTHLATFGTLSDGDTIGVVVAFSADNGGGMANVVEDTTPQLGGFLDTNSKFISHAQGAAIASVAGDTNIWTNFDGNTVHVTGTNAITDFGTPKSAGDSMWVIFDAAASVVDSATITVAGNTNYQAAANDLALVYALTTSTFLFMPFPNSGASPVYDSDTAKLDVDQVWAGAQRATVTAITSSSNSMAITLGSSNDYSHTFTENTTLANPGDTAVAGQSGSLFLTQAAGANYTLAFGSEYDFAAGSAPTVTAVNAARDRLDYVVRADGKIEITAVLNLS